MQAAHQFSDTHVALYLVQSGKTEWLRIKGRGVHHYYIDTLWGLVKKRQRATVHFLNMYRKFKFTWARQKPGMPGWAAAIFCATFVGPCFQMLAGLIRSRDIRWLWHPWACFASALGLAWGLQTFMFRSKEKNLIQTLQPKQKIGR